MRERDYKKIRKNWWLGKNWSRMLGNFLDDRVRTGCSCRNLSGESTLSTGVTFRGGLCEAQIRKLSLGSFYITIWWPVVENKEPRVWWFLKIITSLGDGRFLKKTVVCGSRYRGQVPGQIYHLKGSSTDCLSQWLL